MSRSRILAFVQLVAPDDDGLEGQRAFAQAGDHRLAAGLDALGDGDLALAREQLHRAHVAQVHAHGIVGALGRLGAGLRRRQERCGGDARGSLLLLGRLVVGSGFRALLAFLALDHGDAHVGQHRHGVLDLLGGHLLGGEHGIQLVIGDVAARLGGLDELLDRRIGQVEQRAVALGGFRGGAVCRFCILGVSHEFKPSRLRLGPRDRVHRAIKPPGPANRRLRWRRLHLRRPMMSQPGKRRAIATCSSLP